MDIKKTFIKVFNSKDTIFGRSDARESKSISGGLANYNKSFISLVSKALEYLGNTEGNSLCDAIKNCTPDIDIITSFELQNNTYNLGDFKDQVLRIRNIGDDPTKGLITVFMSDIAGFTITFDQTQTTASVVLGSKDVNNNDWIAIPMVGGIAYQSIVSIPGNGESKIGIITEATQAGVSSTMEIIIQNGSGGETNYTNNSDTKLLSVSA